MAELSHSDADLSLPHQALGIVSVQVMTIWTNFR
jgi:hypothetical protein